MAETIKAKLRKKAAEIALDDSGAIAGALKWQAIDAILKGPGSSAWRIYMENFAETPEQLARLNLEDEQNGRSDIRSSVAYMVGNAICGTATGTQTHRLVQDAIDEGLAV